MQLLIGRTSGAERELLDAIAREAGMRMTVDETGDSGKPAAVDLDNVVAKPSEPPHWPDVSDMTVLAQDVRVLG